MIDVRIRYCGLSSMRYGSKHSSLHVSAFKQIQKWDLLDKDFSIPGGELSEYNSSNY